LAQASKMCLAMVSPHWPAGRTANGVVAYTAEMVSALERCGTRPVVFSEKLGEGALNGQAERLDTQAWSRRWLSRHIGRAHSRWGFTQPFLARQMGKAIVRAIERRRSEGLGLVEMEESFGWARFVAGRSAVPVVVRLHGPWFLVGPALGFPDNRAFRRRVAAEAEGMRCAAAVSAPSRFVLEQAAKRYALERDRLAVVPNPAPVVREENRWRAEQSESGRVLFVGRFDRCKGGDVMIDAFAKVASEDAGARLTFVGPDPGVRDGRRAWSIEQYISERLEDGAIRRRIDRRGLQSAEAIRELRRRASVVVVCSRFENFPMVALEAMAMGCPIVATAVGGLPEIVQHERNGLLCRAGDAEDLAEKIARLLGDRQLAARLGRQAASDCAERYHPDVIAGQMLKFYGRVIERFRDRHRG